MLTSQLLALDVCLSDVFA
ncbi:DUF645 family protein [Vibrio paracholerae]|nr:DUF645 family protein [Vibrio paracholerae]MCO7014078.1 DUF645 family protein [Vibrio paracholerae]MCO7017765.1 DUF645 family protein [Vibrio paracholerae]MCO7034700.1 DUF645 family protein [Vibrio paracholerae]MCO7048170.1 DUF645 family protein [Vibrio paracholerae]